MPSRSPEVPQFIPQGEAFAGAKKEVIGLGVDEATLAKVEQIQSGQYVPLVKSGMVLRREDENSYRIARVEDMDK